MMSDEKRKAILSLKEMLRKIWDDQEFVDGTAIIVSHYPNGIELMTEYILRGEDVDSDQVCMVSLDIANGKAIFDD